MTHPILRERWAAKDDLARECGNGLRLLLDELNAPEESGRPRALNPARVTERARCMAAYAGSPINLRKRQG